MTPIQTKSPPYPKPGPIGGGLIREVISFARSHNKMTLPIGSHILIGVSGGCDSVALAHLLVHFGRRIVPRSRISLLHVNHGWRGKESNADELFVKRLGKKWNVPVITHRLNFSKYHDPKKSWENEARELRKDLFARDAEKHKALVFTAHQADDQAETLLWRLFTGAASTHGGGVIFRHGVEVRPFLRCRKTLIKNYLLEVDQNYREDATNQSDRFMRARMRTELMPAIEKLFPRSIEHLVQLALSVQADRPNLGSPPSIPYDILIKTAGLKMRRPHFETLSQKLVAKKSWCGEIHLPGGWKLICQPPVKWTLERI